MLTPRFSVSQDENFIFIEIKCPFLKADAVEFFIEGSQFKFYAKPYFLRLEFSGQLIENGQEDAKYDVDSGMLSCKIPKSVKGDHFEDLDMLTKLIQPSMTQRELVTKIESGSMKGSSMIQEISSSSSCTNLDPSSNPTLLSMLQDEHDLHALQENEEHPGALDLSDFNWEYPQNLEQEELSEESISISNQKYGFNDEYSGFGTQISLISQDLIEIDNLDQTTPAVRRQIRLMNEDLKFNEDHYIHDYIQRTEIDRLLKFKPKTWSLLKAKQQSKAVSLSNQQGCMMNPHEFFTDCEKDAMIRLKNKTYLLENEVKVYLGLIDLLFSYSYNARVTEEEDNVESAWTIVKVSSMLSCLVTFTSLSETIIACVRRTLCYPLFRHFDLAVKCVQDVIILLKLGKPGCLKALLGLKSICEGDESTYIISRLWLEDYCVWVQQADPKRIQSLASQLHHLSITKDDLGFPLSEIEEMAEQLREDVMNENEYGE